MSKQEFIESLKYVDHRLEGIYPNEFVMNNRGWSTGLRVLNERLVLNAQDGLTIVCQFDKIKVEKIDKSLFIQSINDNDTTGFFVMLRKVQSK